jgi:hypothetical protein
VGDEEVLGVRGRGAVVVVSRQHRDAVHPELFSALSRLGDVCTLLNRDEHAAAQRLSIDMRRVMALLDAFGWAPEVEEQEFEIAMDAVELAHTIFLLQTQTAGVLTIEIREAQETELEYRGSLRAVAAYGAILTQLDGPVSAWNR